MKEEGQLVLGFELDVLPFQRLEGCDRLIPATDLFRLHRQVERDRFAALTEPVDVLQPSCHIAGNELVLRHEAQRWVGDRLDHASVQVNGHAADVHE
jgi:hypothetical protein